MKEEMQTLQKKLLQQSVSLSLSLHQHSSCTSPPVNVKYPTVTFRLINVSCNPGCDYIKCPIVKNIYFIRCLTVDILIVNKTVSIR